MKKTLLFYKNSFKELNKKTWEIISIAIISFFCFTFLFGVFNFSSQVSNEHNKIMLKSNFRDAIIDGKEIPRINQKSQISIPYDQQAYQQYFLNKLAYQQDFYWTRTEARILQDIKHNNQAIKVKAITKTNSNIKGVDDLVIYDGMNIGESQNSLAKRQVVISKGFAEQNNVKVGNIIRLFSDKYGDELLVEKNFEVKQNLDKFKTFNDIETSVYANMLWFEVVGIGTSADYISPVFDKTDILANTKKELNVYVEKSNFGLSDVSYEENETRKIVSYSPVNSKLDSSSQEGIEVTFSLKFRSNKPSSLKAINDEYFKLAKLDTRKQILYDSSDSNYIFYRRVATYYLFQNIILLTYIGLIIICFGIFLISFFIFFRKYIDNFTVTIGNLKAIGYSKKDIFSNFIIFPFLITTIATIFGFICSISFSYVIKIILGNYLTLNLSIFTNLNYWAILICYLTVIFASFVIILIEYIKKNKLSFAVLLNGIISKNKKYKARRVSNWSLSIKIRIAIARFSIAKIATLTLSIFVTTIMISFVFVVPFSIKTNYEKFNNAANYQNRIIYNSPISSNPLSFLKTYNPTYNDKEDGWGYNLEEKAIGNSYSTPYPIIKKNSKNEIDFEKVFDSVKGGNISQYFNTYDLSLGKAVGEYWSELSYLGWKNLDINFLLELDKVEIDDNPITNQVFKNVLFQWKDYSELMDSVDNITTAKEYNQLLLRFYKKYTQGLPVSWNEKIINKNEKQVSKWNWFNNVIFKKISKIPEQIRNRNKEYNFFNEDITNSKTPNWDYPYLKYEGLYKNNNNVDDFLFYLDDKDEYIDLKDYVSEDFNDEEISKINSALTLWFTGLYEKRIGTAIMQISYTSSPIFIQQKIKQKINDESNFNISFGITPFDKKKEELGTLLSAKYEQENFNIYGINQDTDNVILYDKNDKNLTEKLFAKNTKSNKIVINKSLAKKLNLMENQIVDFEIIKDAIFVNDKVLKIDDFSKTTNDYIKSNNFTSVGQKRYYSANGVGFSAAIIGGLEPHKLGKVGLTGRTTTDASKVSPVHKAFLNSEILFNKENVNKKFEIVGIQNGLGPAQAWIANDKANQILEYDKTQKWFFGNWFVKEWLLTKQFNDIISDPSYTRSNEMLDFIKKLNSSSENNESLYQEFLENVSKTKESDLNDAFKISNDIFNNLYPVFNFKYSNSLAISDLNDGFSSMQRLGDYSNLALNGGFEPDDPNREKYYEGNSMIALKNLEPYNSIQIMLLNIVYLVNAIVILMGIIGIFVTILMCIMISSIIFYDNKEFIKTLKILGYKNSYIFSQFTSVLVWPIIIAFCFGLTTSILITNIAFDIISNKSLVIIPNLSWPVILGICVLSILITITSIIISWKINTKNK